MNYKLKIEQMSNYIKLLAVVLLMTFGSCKQTEQKNSDSEALETQTITHELGTTNVVKNPKRAVALDFASLEMLDLLGVEVVGVPKASIPDHLSKYEDDTSVVDLGNLKEINFEALNELQPDVIFMSGRLQSSYDEISKIAPTVYTDITYTDYVGSIEKNAQIFAEIFEGSNTTDQALAEIKKQIKQLQNKIKDLDENALVVLHNKGRFSAYGKGSRFGMIHDVLGINEAAKNLEVGRHGQRISNEFIQNANPDYLYVIDRSAVVDLKATNKAEIENQLIQQTNAYKNGKIIYLNPEIWYLSGGGIYSLSKMTTEIETNL